MLIKDDIAPPVGAAQGFLLGAEAAGNYATSSALITTVVYSNLWRIELKNVVGCYKYMKIGL